METKSSNEILKKVNDFENICESSKRKDIALQGFLKVTQNGQTDVYDDNGNRLSFKNKQELIDDMCARA